MVLAEMSERNRRRRLMLAILLAMVGIACGVWAWEAKNPDAPLSIAMLAVIGSILLTTTAARRSPSH